ncbi:MAG: type II/IV secretion system ATPase subunit [Methanomassiliicoccales archaeon]|nr:type II/IV secretion system ATPase subunit [Methanomassiliicoccales archaeon]
MAKVVIRTPISSQPMNTDQRSIAKKGFDKLVAERSTHRPHYSGCWLVKNIPRNAKKIEEYDIKDAHVQIFYLNEGIEYLYHIAPWEYELSNELTRIVRKTIEHLGQNPPREFSLSFDELSSYVQSTSLQLITSLTNNKIALVRREYGVANEQLQERLARIVARYTVGLGILETMLSDDHIEDIYIDAPAPENPIYVTLNGISGSNSIVRCATNVVATNSEIEGLVSRFRQYSRRPFSEAFPVMEIDVASFDTRATVIGPPLSPMGTAIALRRHSRFPWTLLKLAFNETIDCFIAALISFLIDGRATILICGPRGAGKSALLGATLFEFPRTQRILAIEDTSELPIRKLQQLGYKIQSILVENEIGVEREEKTDEALRVSLRLGESAIVLGEVRGKEAITLYESMRTGKAGSSVLGTIHGDSARSVYERVVHDMGIPKEAFGATDIVITLGLYRPHGSPKQMRKIIELTELKKDSNPGEFRPLVEFDHHTGKFNLHSIKDSGIIERIAKSWNLNCEEAWMNILTRAKMREVLLAIAQKGRKECLEPEWIAKTNEFLWQRMDVGKVDHELILNEFESWVQRRLGLGEFA